MLQILHAAATAALSPSTAGEGGSTIPAAVLQPLQNCTAIAAGGSITVLPTADIQVMLCMSISPIHTLEVCVLKALFHIPVCNTCAFGPARDERV